MERQGVALGSGLPSPPEVQPIDVNVPPAVVSECGRAVKRDNSHNKGSDRAERKLSS